MNISLSTSKKSILQIFRIEIVEHVWIVNDSNYLAASVFSNLLILITNGYLLWFIIKKTFLDQMIFFDCILCISNIFTLVHISYKLFYCHFIPFFSYFINLCNRLLMVSIVFYRYICVIKHNWVRSTQHTMEMNMTESRDMPRDKSEGVRSTPEAQHTPQTNTETSKTWHA